MEIIRVQLFHILIYAEISVYKEYFHGTAQAVDRFVGRAQKLLQLCVPTLSQISVCLPHLVPF